MLMNIIMLVCMYPVGWVMYFVFRYEGKYKKGILFGTRIQQELTEQEEIKSIRSRYFKSEGIIMAVMAILPLSAFLIPYSSIKFNIWMLWILIVCFIFAVPFAVANHRVRCWKQENGQMQKQEKLVNVEMVSIKNVSRVRLVSFLVPIAVAFGSAAGSVWYLQEQKVFSYAPIQFSIAAMTALIYLMALCTDRMRVDVISTNSDININYARAKKNVWSKFWLSFAWLNTIYSVALSLLFVLQEHVGLILLLSTVIYGTALVVVSVRMAKKIMKLQNKYEEKREIEDTDDDRHWLWGMFYCNPQDHRTLIEKRVGVGTTTNFATPLGKVLCIISIIVCISIPACGIWLICLEFTPIKLKINEDKLVATQLKTDYEIPLDEMNDITLIQELPDWTKCTGTGMETLEKGTFDVYHQGKCEVFLNPQNEEFIRFQVDGIYYYFGAATDDETVALYHSLTE